MKIRSPNSPLVHVDIGLLADQVRVTTSDTLDLGKGVHDLATTLDVGVEQTQNVLLGGVSIGSQIDSMKVRHFFHCDALPS